MGYSDFLEQVRNKQIKSAIIQEGQGGTEIVAKTQRTTAKFARRRPIWTAVWWVT